jgi:hypothetical protein
MDEEHGGEERTHRNNSGPGDDEQDCLSRSTIRPWRLATMTIDERWLVASREQPIALPESAALRLVLLGSTQTPERGGRLQSRFASRDGLAASRQVL